MSDIAGSLVPLTKQQAMIMLESAYLLMEMGNAEQARETALGCAVLMPKSEVPQMAIGTIEFNQARYDKALQAFRAAQRLAPKSALPRAHCGEALQAMGKLPEAMKELNEALKLEPASSAASFSIALMIVIGNKEFDTQKYDASLKTMSTVIAHAPDNALAQAHYGKSLIAVGKEAEGFEALKRAVALDAEGEGGQVAKYFLDMPKPKPSLSGRGKSSTVK